MKEGRRVTVVRMLLLATAGKRIANISGAMGYEHAPVYRGHPPLGLADSAGARHYNVRVCPDGAWAVGGSGSVSFLFPAWKKLGPIGLQQSQWAQKLTLGNRQQALQVDAFGHLNHFGDMVLSEHNTEAKQAEIADARWSHRDARHASDITGPPASRRPLSVHR